MTSTASSSHPDSVPPRRDAHATTSVVQFQREVPDAIRSLGALADADYADIVTATIGVTPAAPEQVIHAALNGVPRGLLLLIPFVQRALLGFRLKLRPSPDHLLGWKIADRDDNWMRIETASWFLTGHVVMHVDDGRISLASFIRYDRALAALVWPPVSLIHRQVALALVRSAVRVILQDTAVWPQSDLSGT
jgi:hypothetical protein